MGSKVYGKSEIVYECVSPLCSTMSRTIIFWATEETSVRKLMKRPKSL